MTVSIWKTVIRLYFFLMAILYLPIDGFAECEKVSPFHSTNNKIISGDAADGHSSKSRRVSCRHNTGKESFAHCKCKFTELDEYSFDVEIDVKRISRTEWLKNGWWNLGWWKNDWWNIDWWKNGWRKKWFIEVDS